MAFGLFTIGQYVGVDRLNDGMDNMKMNVNGNLVYGGTASVVNVNVAKGAGLFGRHHGKILQSRHDRLCVRR